MSETYYKVLYQNGRCFHGGKGSWYLPSKSRPGKWMPEIAGRLLPCQRGYHILTRIQLIGYLGPAIFEVEPQGGVIQEADKCLCRCARLVRRLENWNERTARLYAADCEGYLAAAAHNPWRVSWQWQTDRLFEYLEGKREERQNE